MTYKVSYYIIIPIWLTFRVFVRAALLPIHVVISWSVSSHDRAMHCTVHLSEIITLTPGNKVLLKKLLVTQLFKELLAFYGTQGSVRCSRERTTGLYPESDESSPRSISLRSNLTWSSRLRLSFPSGVFPSGLHISSFPCVLHSPSHFTLLYVITLIIFGQAPHHAVVFLLSFGFKCSRQSPVSHNIIIVLLRIYRPIDLSP